VLRLSLAGNLVLSGSWCVVRIGQLQCVCVYLFAVVLDGLRGGATLDGPRCAANVIATVCQCGIQ
jgi:Zn finger protein HypA/HybF involved in hydrogenase expression